MDSVRLLQSPTANNTENSSVKLHGVIGVEIDDVPVKTINVDVHSDALDSIQGAAKSSPVNYWDYKCDGGVNFSILKKVLNLNYIMKSKFKKIRPQLKYQNLVDDRVRLITEIPAKEVSQSDTNC